MLHRLKRSIQAFKQAELSFSLQEFTTQIQELPALLLIRRKPSAAPLYPLVWQAIQRQDPPLH
jgi:hypothetical protein